MIPYRNFLSLTDAEIIYIIKDIFPTTSKVDNIIRDRYSNQIACNIYIMEGRPYFASTLILNADKIRTDSFDVCREEQSKWQEYLLAKGCDSRLKNNPYMNNSDTKEQKEIASFYYENSDGFQNYRDITTFYENADGTYTKKYVDGYSLSESSFNVQYEDIVAQMAEAKDKAQQRIELAEEHGWHHPLTRGGYRITKDLENIPEQEMEVE